MQKSPTNQQETNDLWENSAKNMNRKVNKQEIQMTKKCKIFRLTKNHWNNWFEFFKIMHHFTRIRLARIKNYNNTSFGKTMKKWECLYTTDENKTGLPA